MYVVSSHSPNLNPALHRKHGFEEMGTLRSAGFKFEEWLDTTYMQRVLD